MRNVQLVELQVQNVGVIDEAQLEFGPGFNVLTGETGAGKTLLVGALSLCLGGSDAGYRRADNQVLRASAVFEDNGTEHVLTRETTPSGRLRASCDGLVTSGEALRIAGNELLVIHGQHDSLRLRNRLAVLAILDAYGRIDDSELRSARARLKELVDQRDLLGGDPGAREREVSLANFQLEEIDAVGVVSASELDTSLEELERLTEIRDDAQALLSVIDALDGDSDDALLSRFARVVADIPRGPLAQSFAAELTAALESAREAVHAMSSQVGDEGVDPERIGVLEERVGVLRQLARKYGGTLSSVLELQQQLREIVDRFANEGQSLEALDLAIDEQRERVHVLSSHVRTQRLEAAASLSKRVGAQLQRVALANAEIRFDVDGDDGSMVAIRFRPNPGRPEGDLQSIASGGELSRVLLALSLETVGEGLVAVFDEVDAGIGGAVAQQIGECLRELSMTQQVIVVTHLASVAAQADRHFVVTKVHEGNESRTSVSRVEGDDRVSEISRMLSGDAHSAESRALAVSMLAQRHTASTH